jgi:FkbM family methyltransferase
LHKKREFIATDYLINGSVLKEGDVVLDIGANIGYYVLIESQIVGASGKVYAVEPVQENIELLKKNLQLNNIKNVETYQLAFGQCNEESEIYLSSSANLCSMDKKTVGGANIGTQKVSQVTPDTFLKNKLSPSLIRMDVEGYEYEIFKGMPQTLKGDLKILVELHSSNYLSAEKLSEIFQILTQNNFRVRFAVFEGKARENKIAKYLWQKAGVSSTTFVVKNSSLEELQKVMKDHPKLSPNVMFEKQSHQ